MLSYCYSINGLDIFYEFIFMNGDFWERYLLVEEMYSFEYKVLFFVGIIVLFVVGLIFVC